MYSAEYRDLSDERLTCRALTIRYPEGGHVDVSISCLRYVRFNVNAPEELLPIADAIYAACNIPKPDPAQATSLDGWAR